MGKKSLVLLTSVLAISSMASPSLAATQTNIQPQTYQQEGQLIDEEVVQEFEGITFYSSENLSEEHMSSILEMSKNPALSVPKNQSITSSVAPDPGPNDVYVPSSPYSGTITIGPYNRTYSNMETRLAVSALSWILSERLKLSMFRSGALAGGTFGATEFIITPKHVGTWRYKAYDPNVKRYREFATVVHYRYGSFTSPYKVQTYPMFYY